MPWRFEVHGLRTVFGRRLVLLFVITALLPTSWVAYDAYRRIDRQLTKQAGEQTRRIADSAVMALLDRLQLAEAEMDVVARLLADGHDLTAGMVSLPPFHLLTDVAVVRSGGEVWTLDGQLGPPVPRRPDRSAQTPWHLALTPVTGEARSGVWMARSLDDGVILWARLDGDALVRAARLHAEVPGAIGICLLADGAPPVSCTTTLDPEGLARAIRSGLGERRSGSLVYDHPDGAMWLGVSEAYLQVRYGSASWIMVIALDRETLLADADAFRWLFPRVLLVALFLVMLVSNDQIRRSLRPLEALTAAAQRVGGGDLATRVTIRSRDEFGAVGKAFNRMARQLDRQFRSLDALRRIDHAALAEPSRSALTRAVLENAADVVPADAVALCLLDPGRGGVVHSRVADGRTVAEHVRVEWMPGSGDAEIVTAATPPGWVEGVPPFSTEPYVRFLTLRVGRDPAVGALLLASHDPEAFLPEVHQTALRLADQVALALSTADLVDRLDQAHTGALAALGRSVDLVAPWAAGHAERVAALSVAMGQASGLTPADTDRLRCAALLHDIGTIGVPAGILQRLGALRPHEEELLRDHVGLGARVLEPIAAFADIMPVVEQHHERWDGAGYPAGLAGEAIHPLARILAVADEFDTLTSEGPDGPGLCPFEALARIRAEAGAAFAPEAADALHAILRFTAPPADGAVVGHAPDARRGHPVGAPGSVSTTFDERLR